MSSPAASRPERTVLVGVTGGIAIYKAVELVRGLVKDGLQPLVVSTEAAQRFVMPLTFAAVSQAPVLDDATAWRVRPWQFRPSSVDQTGFSLPGYFLNISRKRSIDSTCRTARWRSPPWAISRHTFRPALKRRSSIWSKTCSP